MSVLRGARRIGVYGGAFDPPHLTHVELARAALEQLGLDELRVFPTGHAWHKARTLSQAEHRIAMAEAAFDGLPRTVIDVRETLRAGPTYTVDTLRELATEAPGAQLFLVMGADQAGALQTWHAWDEVLRLATISLAERAPEAGEPPAPPPALPAGTRMVRLQLPPTDASATRIREMIASGRDISGMVPAAVARYIERHHLYQPT